ncbi:MAG: hypothetical protein V4598_05500 [Bdellovibrionota bacterium]
MKYFLLLALMVPLTSHAEWISSSSGRSGGSSGMGGIKFRLLGGLKLQRATMMSKDDFVEKRSLNGIGADAIAGVNIGPLILGAGGSYTKFYQSTDKDDVDGTDTSGDLTQLNGVVGLAFGKLCLIGKYIFKADYKLGQKTEAGESSTYSKPDASYGISLLYRPGGRSTWSLDYTNINFTEAKIGSAKTKLSDSDEQINLNSFGLTYGFMF